MSIVKQMGILDPNSNPATDADVIMTAAIIGHAYTRLKAGKNFRIDLEVTDPNAFGKLDLSDDASKELTDIKAHHSAIAKINKVLAAAGLTGSQVVQMGVSPVYDVNGKKTTITGGTGDLALTDADRYDPGDWTSDEAKLLYSLALGGQIKDAKGNIIKDDKGSPIEFQPQGYQGRGAYTGFVNGRKGGQSGLMSTYRFKVPDFGRRWVPTDNSVKDQALSKDAPEGFGPGDKQRQAWGMIRNNAAQKETKETYKMYFADEDAKRGTSVTLTSLDVVGYVHGLIQAVYDVEWHNQLNGPGTGGTPYEIAVGKDTSKRSSCFTCSLFMEATGHPASSTHIGRGESWCILHPAGTTSQDTSRGACNDKWALYCQAILVKGIDLMAKFVEPTHHSASYDLLKKYLAGKNTPDNKYLYANLILDAVTVHNSEVNRFNATLIS